MNDSLKMKIAYIYSQLRLCEFTEEEINELKAMNHNLSYLITFAELHCGMVKMRAEDMESEISAKN